MFDVGELNVQGRCLRNIFIIYFFGFAVWMLCCSMLSYFLYLYFYLYFLSLLLQLTPLLDCFNQNCISFITNVTIYFT